MQHLKYFIILLILILSQNFAYCQRNSDLEKGNFHFDHYEYNRAAELYKKVILIDDVLYTGRTIRAALDALQDFGRPQKIELCVLVDRRFNRELPIQPDYFGKAIDTVFSQKVKVEWEREEVVLY